MNLLNRSCRMAAGIAIGLTSLLSCSQAAPAAHPAEPDAPPAVMDVSFLYELVRHLYRWHLDEHDLEAIPPTNRFTFAVRRLSPPLDSGDHSEFAEVAMPLLRMKTVLKRSDYAIAETGDRVRSAGFRLMRTESMDAGEPPAPDAAAITVDVEDMRTYLFRTRTQAQFPDDRLSERLRLAVRHELGLAPEAVGTSPQTAYLAPLSPVANEWWVFWETGKKLIRFTSDTDLTNPAVWQHDQLRVSIYDVFSQVVVSMDETPGSNEFRTRNQIGRALYNCIVLGRRLDTPPTPPARPPSTGDRAP